MPRVISFIVLLAIVVLVGAVFFQVMAQFFVPLFLACVLLVVFQPLHARTLNNLPTHPRICAFVTTVLILLVVLLPLIWLGWNAYIELHAMFTASEHGAPPAAVQQEVQPQVQEEQEGVVEDTSPEPSPGFTGRLNKVVTDLSNDFERLTTIRLGRDTVPQFVDSVQNFIGAKLISGVQSAIGILVGLAIMVISLYYFLADGPTMIAAVLHLSPLDPRYEKELLERFGQVSRAVVVATLLSAVVQGALAGIGYYFALPGGAPIFLLTAVTMVTAMVPFVGAAAVWVCVCGWVYLYGGEAVIQNGQVTHAGEPVTAIILAVYCTIIVSGIDNVIKPFILHGQSKLHPLLALLSILGGVQVLGPVGILVGPMLVSFLQALLNMLRKELELFGGMEPEGAQLAEMVGIATPVDANHAAPAIPAEESAPADGHRTNAAKTSPPPGKPAGGQRWKGKRGR